MEINYETVHVSGGKRVKHVVRLPATCMNFLLPTIHLNGVVWLFVAPSVWFNQGHRERQERPPNERSELRNAPPIRQCVLCLECVLSTELVLKGKRFRIADDIGEESGKGLKQQTTGPSVQPTSHPVLQSVSVAQFQTNLLCYLWNVASSSSSLL